MKTAIISGVVPSLCKDKHRKVNMRAKQCAGSFKNASMISKYASFTETHLHWEHTYTQSVMTNVVTKVRILTQLQTQTHKQSLVALTYIMNVITQLDTQTYIHKQNLSKTTAAFTKFKKLRKKQPVRTARWWERTRLGTTWGRRKRCRWSAESRGWSAQWRPTQIASRWIGLGCNQSAS